MKYLLILVLLLGCGSFPEDWVFADGGYYVPPPSLDPDLYVYVIDFMYDATRYGHSPNVDLLRQLNYEDLNGEHIGVCTTWYEGGTSNVRWTHIRVDPTITCEAQLKAVMYHELGHCLMGWDHSESGIMRSFSYSCEHYEVHWDDMVEQLLGEPR